MNNLKKLELKRALWLQGGFLLSQDSLTGEVLNPEFEAIDREFNKRFKANRSGAETSEDRALNQLRAGNKIKLGCF